MRVECKFIRHNNLIKDAENGQVIEEFKSINQAKHNSWVQQSNGTQLGWGAVKVQRD